MYLCTWSTQGGVQYAAVYNPFYNISLDFFQMFFIKYIFGIVDLAYL